MKIAPILSCNREETADTAAALTLKVWRIKMISHWSEILEDVEQQYVGYSDGECAVPVRLLNVSH